MAGLLHQETFFEELCVISNDHQARAKESSVQSGQLYTHFLFLLLRDFCPGNFYSFDILNTHILLGSSTPARSLTMVLPGIRFESFHFGFSNIDDKGLQLREVSLSHLWRYPWPICFIS